MLYAGNVVSPSTYDTRSYKLVGLVGHYNWLVHHCSVGKVYLVKMAGTASLQELLIATHGDAESVDHFKSKAFCFFQNLLVQVIQLLHS